MHKWPEMISLELWPLSLLDAIRISNLTRFTKDGRAPIAYFAKSDAIFNANNEYTFGCPVYVLDALLQNGQSIPKWDP